MPRLVEGSARAGALLRHRGELGHPAPSHRGRRGGDNCGERGRYRCDCAGDGFVSLGTSGVLFVVNDRFSPNPARAVHAFCHALPRRWHQMSVMLSAPAAALGHASGWRRERRRVLAEVATLEEASGSGRHLPAYCQGSAPRTTIPRRRASFFGSLTARPPGAVYPSSKGSRSAWRTGSTRSLPRAPGRHPLVGGRRVAQRVWAQLLADVSERRCGFTPAARRRGLGSGAARHLASGGDERTVCTRRRWRASIPRRGDAAARFQGRLERFRALYRAAFPGLERGRRPRGLDWRSTGAECSMESLGVFSGLLLLCEASIVTCEEDEEFARCLLNAILTTQAEKPFLPGRVSCKILPVLTSSSPNRWITCPAIWSWSCTSVCARSAAP